MVIKLFSEFAVWLGGISTEKVYYCDECGVKIDKYYLRQKKESKTYLYCKGCSELKINELISTQE